MRIHAAAGATGSIWNFCSKQNCRQLHEKARSSTSKAKALEALGSCRWSLIGKSLPILELQETNVRSRLQLTPKLGIVTRRSKSNCSSIRGVLVLRNYCGIKHGTAYVPTALRLFSPGEDQFHKFLSRLSHDEFVGKFGS